MQQLNSDNDNLLLLFVNEPLLSVHFDVFQNPVLYYNLTEIKNFTMNYLNNLKNFF